MSKIFLILLIWASLMTASLGYGSALWDHSKATAQGAFDSTGIKILGLGAIATAIAFNQDMPMHDAWIDYQRMSSESAGFGNFWGSGLPEVSIVAAQLFLDREKGIVGAEGLIGSTVLVHTLKFSAQRPRPDSDTRTSFPSGHTQIAFASATSLAMGYGWKAGLPSYALAVFTGLSRLADNAHWFSDVVAGATVGIIFGRAGFNHHFKVQPLVVGDGQRAYGLMMEWRI